MTYLDFYKLREDPFAAVYERAKYFPTAASAAVIKSLTDGITQRRGLMLLTGRIGIGKTYTLNQLCAQLPPEWVTFHVLSSPQSGDQLLQQLASYVGLPHGSEQLADLAGRLQKQIAWLNERGRRAVLVFEECENLSPEVLARIHWLAEMETYERKLVQIILVARPGFRNKFTDPVWEPIRNRIAMSCELNPMDPHEVAGYIDHRIRGAGDIGCVLEFASEAKADIAAASGGLPRMVNAISRDCLLQGFESRVQYIERDIVKMVLGSGGLGATVSIPAEAPAPAALVPTPIVETPATAEAPAPVIAAPEEIPQFDPTASICTGQSPMLLCAARYEEFKEVPLAVHPELPPVEVDVQTPAAGESTTEPAAETTPVEDAAPQQTDQPEQALTDEPAEFTTPDAQTDTLTAVLESVTTEESAPETAVTEIAEPVVTESPVEAASEEAAEIPAQDEPVAVEVPAEIAPVEEAAPESPAVESQNFDAVEALAETSDTQEPQTAETAATIESLLSNEPSEPTPAEDVPSADSPEAATLTEATQEFLNDPATAATQLEESFLQPDGTPWPAEPAAPAVQESLITSAIEQTNEGENADSSYAAAENVYVLPDEQEPPTLSQEAPAAQPQEWQPAGEQSQPSDAQPEIVEPGTEIGERIESEEAVLDQPAAEEEVVAAIGEESAPVTEDPAPLDQETAPVAEAPVAQTPASEEPAPAEEAPAPVQEEAPQQVLQTASAPVEQPAPTVLPPVIPERIEPARKRDRFAQPREVHLPSEEYRALRTNLLAACDGRFCFVVTSARPKEGKTATCMNLGLMMTERQNTRTVLVDANLRNHKLTDLMGGHGGPGLAEYLRGEASVRDILQPTEYDNLFLIGTGNIEDTEIGELLNRPELAGLLETLKANFDHVIVDAPSVHRTTDATVLGEAAGSAMVVVRMYDTNREAVQMAIRQLRINKVAVSGVVLTNRKFFIPSLLYRHI